MRGNLEQVEHFLADSGGNKMEMKRSYITLRRTVQNLNAFIMLQLSLNKPVPGN